jgi:hypothetical protein
MKNKDTRVTTVTFPTETYDWIIEEKNHRWLEKKEFCSINKLVVEAVELLKQKTGTK